MNWAKRTPSSGSFSRSRKISAGSKRRSAWSSSSPTRSNETGSSRPSVKPESGPSTTSFTISRKVESVEMSVARIADSASVLRKEAATRRAEDAGRATRWDHRPCSRPHVIQETAGEVVGGVDAFDEDQPDVVERHLRTPGRSPRAAPGRTARPSSPGCCCASPATSSSRSRSGANSSGVESPSVPASPADRGRSIPGIVGFLPEQDRALHSSDAQSEP